MRFGTENDQVSRVNANYQRNNLGTTPVGQYKANSLGLHDMSGNVYEWVQDKNTSYSNVGNNNPIYEDRGNYRVVRGGGWVNKPKHLRCSLRSKSKLVVQSGRVSFLGFRLIRVQ